MRTVTVTDPAGVAWQVRVRWRPRHRALWRRFGGWRRGGRRHDVDIPDPTGAIDGGFNIPDIVDDLLVGVALVVALVVLGAVFWWVLIPFLLFLLDVVFVVLLLVLGIGARVLLRRPWSVDATSPTTERALSVVGWRRALRARDGIAAALSAHGEAAWSALEARTWDDDGVGTA